MVNDFYLESQLHSIARDYLDNLCGEKEFLQKAKSSVTNNVYHGHKMRNGTGGPCSSHM